MTCYFLFDLHLAVFISSSFTCIFLFVHCLIFYLFTLCFSYSAILLCPRSTSSLFLIWGLFFFAYTLFHPNLCSDITWRRFSMPASFAFSLLHGCCPAQTRDVAKLQNFAIHIMSLKCGITTDVLGDIAYSYHPFFSLSKKILVSYLSLNFCHISFLLVKFDSSVSFNISFFLNLSAVFSHQSDSFFLPYYSHHDMIYKTK